MAAVNALICLKNSFFFLFLIKSLPFLAILKESRKEKEKWNSHLRQKLLSYFYLLL